MKALLLTLTIFAASAQAAEITTGKQILAHSYFAGYCAAMADLETYHSSKNTVTGDEIFSAFVERMKLFLSYDTTAQLVKQCNESAAKYKQFNEWADQGVQEF